MNLAIDIGNTFVKTGWFEGDKLISKQERLPVNELKQLINAKKPSFVIGSSTAKEIFADDEWRKENFISIHAGLKFPFNIKYKTPETLGADRLAAAAGANYLYRNENLLVIDLGTCITYEFIDKNNNYWGGAISPGVAMRFKAMNHFTARLPLISKPAEQAEIIGDSTVSCMESGVLNGILFEIQNFIQKNTANHGKIIVLMTGGDAKYFDKKLKGDIFAAPDLVLIGLNVILRNNVANI